MKNIFDGVLIASFLVCCICGITNGAAPSSCTESFIADENDCTKFYQCDHGHPIPMTCPGGLNWNANIKGCDWPQNAPCKTTNAPNSQPDTTPSQPEPQPEPVPTDPTPSQPDSTEPPTPIEPNQPNAKCGSQKKSICYCEYINALQLPENSKIY